MKLLLSVFMLVLSFSVHAENINTAKSEFKWKASKKLGKSHWGYIPVKTSDFKVKKGEIKNGTITLNLKDFTVEDLDGQWKSKFLTHVKGDDFFQVEKFPVAELEIVKQVKGNKLVGKLTVKGVTKPVEIDYTLADNVYSGKLVFDRTNFGIVYGAGNIFKELTADKVINNEVEVDFKVALNK